MRRWTPVLLGVCLLVSGCSFTFEFEGYVGALNPEDHQRNPQITVYDVNLQPREVVFRVPLSAPAGSSPQAVPAVTVTATLSCHVSGETPTDCAGGLAQAPLPWNPQFALGDAILYQEAGRSAPQYQVTFSLDESAVESLLEEARDSLGSTSTGGIRKPIIFGLQNLPPYSTIRGTTGHVRVIFLGPDGESIDPIAEPNEEECKLAYPRALMFSKSGSTPQTQAVVIFNQGKQLFDISSLRLTGDGATAFNFGGFSSQFILYPGRAVAIQLNFTATEAGTYSSNLQFDGECAGSDVLDVGFIYASVALTGRQF